MYTLGMLGPKYIAKLQMTKVPGVTDYRKFCFDVSKYQTSLGQVHKIVTHPSNIPDYFTDLQVVLFTC